VIYALNANKLEIVYQVENRGDQPMHFGVGGHPGFRCPMFPGDRFNDYELILKNAEGAFVTGTAQGLMAPDLPHLDKIVNGKLDLSYETFAGDTLIVQNLPAAEVTLVSKKTGHGICFDFTGFSALGLWTMSEDWEQSPFLCLEPWNGLPASSDETTDAKSKKYARTLEPGASHTVGYRVTVL
jgi:galactose mutarotase-like enzyme